MRYDEFCANVPPFFSFEGMDVRSRSGEYKEGNEDGATGSLLSQSPSVEEEENRRIIGAAPSRRNEIRNAQSQLEEFDRDRSNSIRSQGSDQRERDGRENLENRNNLLVIERRKQKICSEINIMQKEEIVRLELKLKEEKLSRSNTKREIRMLEQTVKKKGDIAMKQQKMVTELRADVIQLDESNAIHKAKAKMAQKEVENVKELNSTLSSELSSLKTLLTETQILNSTADHDLKMANIRAREMEAEAAVAVVQKELLEARVDMVTQVKNR